MLRSRQAACLDQLWRALQNASRRLRSRLKRCDTSSRNAPALLLLPVAPDLCRLSRQPNQCRPPLSLKLKKVDRIEGAHGQHNATPSRSTKDHGPRSPWIQRLRTPPDQSGRKRRDSSLATTGPPCIRPLMCNPLSAGCRGVFLVPHGPTLAPGCLTAVIADKIKHIHFQKESKCPFLPTISVLPLCSQSLKLFQPLATRAELWALFVCPKQYGRS